MPTALHIPKVKLVCHHTKIHTLQLLDGDAHPDVKRKNLFAFYLFVLEPVYKNGFANSFHGCLDFIEAFHRVMRLLHTKLFAELF